MEDPRLISADEFRAVMKLWASGVTIVTARAGETIHGMTVSDFSGASLSPPLVVICADRTSITHSVIRDGKCFAVNVLAAGQEELSNRFASKKEEHRRFEGLALATGMTGAPLIPDVLANFDCSLVATHEVGDHDIYVGKVEEMIVRDLEPLIYYHGSYRSLADDA